MFDAKKLLTQMLGAEKGEAAGKTLDEAGGLIGAVFKQAVEGVKEGAGEIEKATGVGAKTEDALKEHTGKSSGDLINQVKEIAERNKVATGAALAGLGALLLGTRTGRGVAGGAVKLGGLALIGGLAYKAYRNHQEGKPLIDTPQSGVDPAPEETAFGETGDADQDQVASILILRAMIAAAASDGAVTNEERSRIVGGLQDAGLDVHAAKFLDEEFASPASSVDIAALAVTDELKTQTYTAARIIIDDANPAETAFLADLANQLGLSADQVAHLDAAVIAAAKDRAGV
ncbi:MAG: DUF533 domain-containing protein [Hyphomonadaceae bacterium]